MNCSVAFQNPNQPPKVVDCQSLHDAFKVITANNGHTSAVIYQNGKIASFKRESVSQYWTIG